jgi:gamma-glutamyltranspeptidase / glutathione hydrolase
MKSSSKKRGAIASGHPETTAAARIILEEGGNAFDAVLGAMAAACVTEPVLSSMGGGGFLLAKPADGTPVLYDFFAHTPVKHPDAAQRDFSPIMCDFGTVQQEFHIGMASIATPGAVKGLFEVNRDLGRMPIGRVIEPALELARNGITMNRLQSYIFEIVGGIYMSTPASREIFASRKDPDRLIGVGEKMSNPAFAGALETIAIEGEDLFYKGEIAQQISSDCRIGGGTLSMADLETYEVIRRQPLARTFKGSTLLTNPPPSSGGMLIAFALALLDGVDVRAMEFGSLEYLRLLARVMELTNHARIESGIHELDDGLVEQALFDPVLLETYRKAVLGQPASHRGTTHISVLDGKGNAAALTLSNGEGAGYVVPDTGIMLNNMLGEEDINPHGFHQWPTNRRMSSMMAPTIVVGDDGDIFALGSGGSNRIRTAILQVLLNLREFGMSLEDAILSPRIHFESGKLNIEAGFDPDLRQEFSAEFDDASLWDERNLFFGGVHGVQLSESGRMFRAAGDERRGGSAVVL